MGRYYLRQKEDGNSLAVFSTAKRVGDKEYMPVDEAQAEIDRLKEYIFDLQAEIDALKKPPCKWTQDEFFEVDGGFYNTSCGNEFSLTDGTPEENNMKYCPFCGGLVEHKGE